MRPPGWGDMVRKSAADRRSASGPRGIGQFDLMWHLPHLLRRAHFEAEACFAGIYGHEATSRQLALLVAVAQSPGASQRDIASRIGLDANTCSDLVRRACDRGWLERRRDQADARAWQLALTPAGVTLVEGTALPRAERYTEQVAARLSAAERRRLAALLRKMLELQGTTSEPE